MRPGPAYFFLMLPDRPEEDGEWDEEPERDEDEEREGVEWTLLEDPDDRELP